MEKKLLRPHSEHGFDGLRLGSICSTCFRSVLRRNIGDPFIPDRYIYYIIPQFWGFVNSIFLKKAGAKVKNKGFVGICRKKYYNFLKNILTNEEK